MTHTTQHRPDPATPRPHDSHPSHPGREQGSEHDPRDRPDKPGRDLPDENGEPPSARRPGDPEASEPPVEDF
ncbi:hypothetical protein ACKI2N_005185 [Cupriavidus sp. 30B13]|uniref:hypothetical protein n=1 Tax=Cupriavidus sp. 30B13 TaxID=3384241 RepID=UPI003B9161AA